jgi:hypothetical protein
MSLSPKSGRAFHHVGNFGRTIRESTITRGSAIKNQIAISQTATSTTTTAPMMILPHINTL